VRDAANALIDALPLGEADQRLRLAKASRIIRDKQKRNAASHRSHAGARQKQLHTLGIRAEQLRCCIPPPGG